MAIKLRVDLRLRIMRKLTQDREILQLAIDWVDDEARDDLRRNMIKWINSMYWVDDARYTLNRYNDLVSPIDHVDYPELERLFPNGLPQREIEEEEDPADS